MDQNFSYAGFIFNTLGSMVGSIVSGAKAIAAALIGFIETSNVLWIIFAIQFSILIVKFILDTDGFALVTSFIRMAVVYAVIQTVLANWNAYGFGFVNFANGLMTRAVSSAASSLLDDGDVVVTYSDNPAEVLAGMQASFSSEFQKIEKQFDKYREGFEKAIESAPDGADSAVKATESAPDGADSAVNSGN